MTNPALPTGAVGGASQTLLLKGVGAGAQPAWQPGQRVEAVVVRQLAATEYLLRVDGALYAADLPGQPAQGTRMPLLFLGAQGAPRFLLLPTGAAASDHIQLSTAGRMLGSLLPGPQATPLMAARPMLAAPTVAAAPIAQALQQALQTSGLSYESHLAGWVQGNHPVSAVLAEPQGLLSSAPTRPGAAAASPLPASPPAPPAPPAPKPSMPAMAVGQAPSPGVQNPPETTLPESGATAQMSLGAAPGSAGTPAGQVVPQPVVPVVQQQLAYLTQGVLVWQGPLWPGQEMQWRLQVEDEDGARQGAASARTWTSTLTLDLPRLGHVQARLRLVGESVHVQLSSPHSAARLATAKGELQRGIAAAGLALQAFSVDDGSGS